ncbi:MAG: TonB C-terminal domain-containing protein [Endomicrobium sp.]|nr:TonB C-terminal domain-containing protein [Endomicrobium sp.]
MSCSKSNKHVYHSVPIEVTFYSSSQYKINRRIFVKSSKNNIEKSNLFMHKQIKENTKKKEETLKNIIVAKIPKNSVKQAIQEKSTLLEVSKGSVSSDSNIEGFQSTNSKTLLPMRIVQHEELSFDAGSFKSAYYSNQIVKKIGSHWRWMESFTNLRTIVYFKIYRDGSVFDILIKESSGNYAYDKNSLDTIARASPFPVLPESYENEWLGVFFEFKYRN